MEDLFFVTREHSEQASNWIQKGALGGDKTISRSQLTGSHVNWIRGLDFFNPSIGKSLISAESQSLNWRELHSEYINEIRRVPLRGSRLEMT